MSIYGMIYTTKDAVAHMSRQSRVLRWTHDVNRQMAKLQQELAQCHCGHVCVQSAGTSQR